MSKLEMAIRNGNFTTEDVIIDGFRTGEKIYIVTCEGSKFPYKQRIGKELFDDISRRIKKEDERKARVANRLWIEPANVEHTAFMADIMAAYDDYRAAIAY